jgi:hypothetical protein
MGLSFIKLLKTSVEKMSAFRLSTMLMKTSELEPSLHDVDENKWLNRMSRFRVPGARFQMSGVRG